MTKTKTHFKDTTKEFENSAFWRILGNLPEALSVALAVFGSVCLVLVLFEQFKLQFVFLFGLPLAALIFYLISCISISNYSGARKERRLFDILAVTTIIVWGVFNSLHVSQNVYLYRDPGLYNAAAAWLTDHNDLKVPPENPFGGNDHLAATSNSGAQTLGENPDRIYLHGQHLLPAMSAVVGRMAQSSAALKVNVLFGAMALLSVYGFTRSIARPRWAYLTTVVLALTLPMLYFSRDMYTEPLAMLFIFGALSLLHTAQKTGNRYAWLGSGLAAGASLSTRIDSYIAIAGIVAYFMFYMLTSSRKQLRERSRMILIFGVGAMLTGLIGWLDLSILSKYYYSFHDHLVIRQIQLILAIIAFGLTGVLLERKYLFIGKLDKITRRWRGWALAILVTCTLAGLFARPLLSDKVAYFDVQRIGGTEAIVIEKSPTDKSIEYGSDPSILWSGFYVGWAFYGIAFVGLLYMVMHVAAGKDNNLLLPFILVFGFTALLYFYSPSITPDHIWASRRLLPVVIPGCAVLVAYLLSNLSTKIPFRRLFYVGISAVFIFSVFRTSMFYMTEKTHGSLLSQVNELCDSVPDESAVLLVGVMGLVAVQTISSYCGVPVVRYTGAPTQAEYKEFYENALINSKIAVVALFKQDATHLPTGSTHMENKKYDYETIQMVFKKAPDTMVSSSKQIIYGFLNENGITTTNYEPLLEEKLEAGF